MKMDISDKYINALNSGRIEVELYPPLNPAKSMNKPFDTVNVETYKVIDEISLIRLVDPSFNEVSIVSDSLLEQALNKMGEENWILRSKKYSYIFSKTITVEKSSLSGGNE